MQVFERQVALVEFPLADPLIDQLTHQAFEIFARGRAHRADGGFARIGQHQDRGLLAARTWPAVAEIGLVDRLPVGGHTLGLGVEIAGERLAVVFADKILDAQRQTVFLGQVDAIIHMAENDLCAGQWVELVVW